LPCELLYADDLVVLVNSEKEVIESLMFARWLGKERIKCKFF